MIQKVYHNTFHRKNTFLLIILLISLINIPNLWGQLCPSTAGPGNIGADVLQQCAPIQDAFVYGQFTLRVPPGCTFALNDIVFDVDWGDGNTSLGLTPTGAPVNYYNDVTGKYYRYFFNDASGIDTQYKHTYPTGLPDCYFMIVVTFKVKSTGIAIATANYPIRIYHQTDDYSGSKPLKLEESVSGENLFFVCVGQETCVQFQDNSELNCNPTNPIEFDPNSEPRHIQFEYGLNSSTIPGVTVAGVPVPGTYFDGGFGTAENTVTKVIKPGPTTGIKTSVICVPGTTTLADVGKEFYIKLYNWNKCNPYPGNAPITTTATIRLVAAPPKPGDQTKVYCNRTGNTYNSSSYTTNLVHNPETVHMSPGTYYWFLDDGTGTGPVSTDPVDAIYTTSSKNGFNPTTLFPNSHAAYLNIYTAQRKIYWVIYQFNNNLGYNVVCNSEPAKIEYVIREDISASPTGMTGPTRGCPDDEITLNLPDPNATPYPIGGAVEYVWDAGANCTITGVESTSGRWVKIKLTASPGAPSTATATVTVYKRWKNPVSVSPTTCATSDCPHCPSSKASRSITINPRPVAKIKGGGTICADETLDLTVYDIWGAPSSTTFDITLTNGESITGHNRSSDAIIAANPANGTSTLYTIATIKDNQTGCINTNLTPGTTVDKRAKLVLAGPITGPDPVCEGTSNNYTLPAVASPMPPNNTATRYEWRYAGTYLGTGTGTTWAISTGAALDASTPATRTISTIWQYTTQAGKSKLADKYCSSAPVTKTITVRPRPSVKVNAATLKRTVCLNSGTTVDIDLTGTPNVAWTVEWKVTGSANQTITVPATATGKTTYSVVINPSFLPTAGNYAFTLESVSQLPAGACAGSVSTPNKADIKVLKNPMITIPSTSITVCEKTDVDIPINLTGENTGTYRVTYTVSGSGTYTKNFTVPLSSPKLEIPWSQINQGNGAITTVTITQVEEQTKDLNGLDISCFYNTSLVYTITNQANPSAANAGPGQSVCTTTLSPYTLSANNPTSPYTGQWSIASAPACSGTFSSTTANNATFTPNCNGVYVLEWTISGGACPPTTSQVTLEWGKSPNTAAAGSNQNWCYDLSNRKGYTLAGNAPDLTIERGRWTPKAGNPGIASFDDATSNITKVTVDAYGTYTFIWELYNSCGNSKSEVQITFIEIPRLNIVPSQSWCPLQPNGMPAFTSTVAGSTITWQFTGGGGVMSGFPASGTAPFPATNTPDNITNASIAYEVEVKVENLGCSSTDNIKIDLKPRPQLEPISPTTMCAGAQVTFKLNPDLGKTVIYDWSNSNTAIGLGASGPVSVAALPFEYPFNVTNSSSAPEVANISLTAEVDGCISNPEVFTLTVNPLPVVTVPSPNICAKDNVDATQTTLVSSVGGTIYTWSYAGTYIGLTSPTGNSDNLGPFNAVDNVTNAAYTGTVTFTANANGCTVSGSYPISVKPRPNMKPVTSLAQCPLPGGAPAGGASGTFGPILFESVNFTTGVTYDWDVSGGAILPGVPGSGNNLSVPFGDNTSGGARAYNMMVTGTGDPGSPAEGCTSDPVNFTLTVNPRPVTQLRNYPTQPICSGQTFTPIDFYDNTGGTATFDWTVTNPVIMGMPGSGTGNMISPIGATANTTGSAISGVASIQATSPAGCVGPERTVTLTVNPTPILIKPADITACSNVTVAQTNFSNSNIVGPVLYTWSITDPSVGVGLPSFVVDTSAMRSFKTTVNNSSVNKTAKVEVTGRIGNCVSNPVNYNITVYPNPRVNRVNDIVVCPGASVKLPTLTNTVTGNDASVISWQLDNGNIANPVFTPLSGTGNINPSNFVANTNTSGSNIVGKFTLHATVNGCQGPDSTFRVTVKPTPDVLPISDVFYCDNVTTTPITFSSSSSGVTFNWARTGDEIGLTDATGTTSIPSFLTKNSSSQKLLPSVATISVYTDANGCKSASTTFKITVRPVPQMSYANPEFCANVPTTPAPFTLIPVPGVGDVTSFYWEANAGDLTALPQSGLPSGTQTGNLPLITPNITNPTGNNLYGDNPQYVRVDVVPILNGCEGKPAEITIQYNPIPKTEIFLPPDPCVSASSDNKLYYADQALGTPGSTYDWTITNGNPGAYTPTMSKSVNHVVITYPSPFVKWTADLNVQETNSYGCLGSWVTKQISVLPAPVVDAGPDLEVCQGQEVQMQGQVLQHSGGTLTYYWTGGYIVGGANSTTPTVKPLANVTMSFYAEEDGCRSDPDQAIITVRGKPAAPYIETPSFCSSDQQMIIEAKNVTPGNDHRWGRMTGSSFSAIPNTNNVVQVDLKNPLYTGALPSPIPYGPPRDEAIITYGIFQIQNYGTISCHSDTMQNSIVIGRIPDRPVPVNTTACKDYNTRFTVSVTGSSGTFFKWYTDTITKPMVPVPGNNNQYTASISTPGNYEYYATQVAVNGCESYPVPVRLTVWANPALSFTVTDPVSSAPVSKGCADLNINATNTSSNPGLGTTYHWEWGDLLPNIPSLEGATASHTYSNSTPFTVDANLKLVGVSLQGCESQEVKVITVFPKLHADFDYQLDGCSPTPADFISRSTGGSSFKWDFDDGTTATTMNDYISHVFDNTGHVINLHRDQKIYNVKLVAMASHTGGFVCKDSIVHPITVNPSPKADFDIYEKDQVTPAPAWICSPDELWLDNKHWTAGSPPGKGVNTPLTEYQWGVNSLPNTGRDTTYLFENPDVMTKPYNIILYATNEYGCEDRMTKTIQVVPNLIPNFTVSDDEGCAPLDVTLNDMSRGARVSRWYWTGTTATPPANGQAGADYTGANAWNTFANTSNSTPRVYRVWLQIENGVGTQKCYKNADTLITVYPIPVATFTHNAPSGGICPPDMVTFTNTSTGNSAGTSYSLDMGDGHTVNPWTTPTHQHGYTTSTRITRQVIFRAENEYFCENSAMSYITVNPQVSAKIDTILNSCSTYDTRVYSQSNGATNYQWTFTGSSSPLSTTTAIGPSPPVKFVNASHSVRDVIQVKLVASNSYCSAIATTHFEVFPEPAASFTTDVTQGCQPLRVNFTNTSTGNPGSNMEYLFSFGDGFSGTMTPTPVPVQHIYTNLDNANLDQYPKLTVKNGWGCVSTFSSQITVFPYVFADFRMDPTAGCPPLDVSFRNNSRGHTTSDWQVDGSHISAAANPTYTFLNPDQMNDKVYAVKLVADNGQCKDDTIQYVTVYRKPVADFTVSPMTQFYPGSTIAVTNQIPSPAKNTFTYIWSLTDVMNNTTNSFSTLPDPTSETIGKWGTFDVTQNVFAPNCWDKKTLTISIIPPVPLASFDSVPPACMPYEVNFKSTSKNANRYVWDFGDGVMSTQENPKHTYVDAGTYRVTLTITGDGGTDTYTRFVVVHPMPVADFDVSPKFLWVGQALRAFNNTSHATSFGQTYKVWYKWDWGDGSAVDTTENPSHIYRKAGKYDITLTTGTYTSPQCVNVRKRESVIELENAGDIILPNTFKPWDTGPSDGTINSGGYQNNLFYPPVLSPTRKYHFVVYNRWGQLIFETEDPQTGWDGYYKGRLCDEGVYIYKIEGVFETGQSFSKMGDVLLLR